MKTKFMVLFLLGLTLVLQAEQFTSFDQFQNHIKKESQRVMNSDQHAQIRAERDDREYVVGETKMFWRFDFTHMPPGWEQVQATCRAVGEYCYVFISDEEWNVHMDQGDVDIVFNYLENITMASNDFGAIEMDINLFGDVPDELDNDPKIIVYYSALGSYNGSVFDGYFSSYNQVTEQEAQQMNPPGHSNECEMIYMTCSPLSPIDPTRISVLSHELQHMIHWGGDINEVTWVDEGMAELAMVHFGMPDPITSFNANANYSLNMWDQQWKDYVKVLLFFTYLDEHFVSEDFISDIVSEPLNGISGIANQMIEHGFTMSFETLFTNWTIANFLDEEDIYDGLFNYESLELPVFYQNYFHSNYPVNNANTVQPWATMYVKLSHDTNLSVNINVDHEIQLGILTTGIGVESQVEIITISDDNTITLPSLEEDYDYHVLVFANSNDQELSFSYDIEEGAILYGDVDGNGEIQSYDASLTLQAAVGLITLTTDQFIAADVDGNGELQTYDAALILQYATGLITVFPVEE